MADIEIDIGKISEALNDKQDIGDCVLKTGDEMSGTLVRIPDVRNKMTVGSKSPFMDKASTVAPDESAYACRYGAWDRNGTYLGNFSIFHATSNRFAASMGVEREVDGVTKAAQIMAIINADGTLSTYAPTPPADSSTTEIATTAWVNSNSVNKTGDTMSGNLGIVRSTGGGIYYKRSDLDYTSTTVPSTAIDIGNFGFQDKNGKYFAYTSSFLSNTGTQTTRIIARRSISGSEKTNIFDIGVDTAGKPYYNRPQIITAYVSGKNGYNIWSNGYCEQWGYVATPAAGGSNVTLFKTMKDTNYNVIASNAYVSSTEFRGARAGVVNNKTISVASFTSGTGTSTTAIFWRACGYLAADQY